MARIAGVQLQDRDRIGYALTAIKGIGYSLSKKVLEHSSVEPWKKVSELSTEEVSRIASGIEAYSTEGTLAQRVRADISRLKTINSYRGTRHARGLPVRGQRTRRNARTKRGKRKTVGAFRKEALTKMQQQRPKKEGE